jgi:ubiquinone/menaquinone biosynthesis C-methylase UbiE
MRAGCFTNEGKPRDRELLLHFLQRDVSGRGVVCDMGCGPGHVARFLHDAGARSSGSDLSPEMLAHARSLNPDMVFHAGNILALDLPDNSLAGITAFYAIVNIPAHSLPIAFREMHRVLQPDGLLLMAFHIGGEVIRPEEMWGQKVEMEFYHFDRALVERLLSEAGFRIEDVVEREPYAPEIEYQSRRAYIFARKAETVAA